jgi:cell filamentation protein
MVRKMHDHYLYPHSDVLINKANICDAGAFNEMQAEFASLRIRQIGVKPLDGSYNFDHFCEFHKTIFQDVFEWAGKPRTINVEKPEIALNGLSVEYADHTFIVDMANSALSKLNAIDKDKLTIDGFAELLAKGMAELWKVHAFREGNTRTVIMFSCQLAESKGYTVDRTLFETNSAYLRRALVAASAVFKDLGDRSKSEYLVKIVRDSLSIAEPHSVREIIEDCKVRAVRQRKTAKNTKERIER